MMDRGGIAAIPDAGGTTMVVGTENIGSNGMPENAGIDDGLLDAVGSMNEFSEAVRARTVGNGRPETIARASDSISLSRG